MLTLLILACSWLTPSGPPEPPERWDEVEALAQLDQCELATSPPTDLASLVAWKQQAANANKVIDGLTLHALLDLGPDTPLDAAALSTPEAEAIAAAVRDLERCGGLVDGMIGKLVRSESCGTPLATLLGDTPEPAAVAAREAIIQWELVTTTTEQSGRSYVIDETAIARDWQDWVLAPDGPAPTGPKVSSEAGVLGQVLGEGLAGGWNEFVTVPACPPQ